MDVTRTESHQGVGQLTHDDRRYRRPILTTAYVVFCSSNKPTIPQLPPSMPVEAHGHLRRCGILRHVISGNLVHLRALSKTAPTKTLAVGIGRRELCFRAVETDATYIRCRCHD